MPVLMSLHILFTYHTTLHHDISQNIKAIGFQYLNWHTAFQINRNLGNGANEMPVYIQTTRAALNTDLAVVFEISNNKTS